MARTTSTDYAYTGSGDHSNDRIALLVSRWHTDLTNELAHGALQVLRDNKVEYTLRRDVPGSFELPLAAKFLARTRKFDAILALGVIVKGETMHDEVIAHAVARGLMDVQLKYRIPVLMGVLTVNNLDQAWARTGGGQGHKGKEVALGALEMIDLMQATRKG